MSKQKGVSENYIREKLKEYESDLAEWQRQSDVARENVSRLTGAILSLRELLNGEEKEEKEQ